MSKSMLGQTINNQYLLTDVLGEGGMGIVFKAEDLNLNRRLCAIKLLKGQTTDPNEAKRFEAELQIISRLRSPHVVQVLNKGYFEGHRLYIVMELLEGEALSSLIKKTGAFQVKRAIQITKGILAGLSEAHDYGVVHRDLKPANIFITRSRAGDEITKVLDFGIAKDTNKDDLSGLTSASMIIGTPKYMAPEQFMKNDTDQRTDLYAVGLLLYQMLCGEPPYIADSDLVPETLKTMPSEFKVGWLHLNAEPKSLDVFPPLWDLCKRLLEKQAEDRPNSAAEVIAELKEISERISSGSHPYFHGQGQSFTPTPQHGQRLNSSAYQQPSQLQQAPIPNPPSGPHPYQPPASGLSQLADPAPTTGIPINSELHTSQPKKSSRGLMFGIVVMILIGGVAYFLKGNMGGSRTKQSCYHKFKVSPAGFYKLSKKKLKDVDGQIVSPSFEQPLGQTNQNGSLPAIIQLTCGEEWQIKAQRKGFKDLSLSINALDASKTHTHQMRVVKDQKASLEQNSESQDPKQNQVNDSNQSEHHKKTKAKSKTKSKTKDKPKKSSWKKKRSSESSKSSAYKTKRRSKQKVNKPKETPQPAEPKKVETVKPQEPKNTASPGLMF